MRNATFNPAIIQFLLLKERSHPFIMTALRLGSPSLEFSMVIYEAYSVAQWNLNNPETCRSSQELPA